MNFDYKMDLSNYRCLLFKSFQDFSLITEYEIFFTIDLDKTSRK